MSVALTSESVLCMKNGTSAKTQSTKDNPRAIEGRALTLSCSHICWQNFDSLMVDKEKEMLVQDGYIERGEH